MIDPRSRFLWAQWMPPVESPYSSISPPYLHRILLSSFPAHKCRSASVSCALGLRTRHHFSLAPSLCLCEDTQGSRKPPACASARLFKRTSLGVSSHHRSPEHHSYSTLVSHFISGHLIPSFPSGLLPGRLCELLVFASCLCREAHSGTPRVSCRLLCSAGTIYISSWAGLAGAWPAHEMLT